MVARIENVPIEKLKPNPYRNLATYPWNEEKIADLQKSYADVGMWEGIIARPINGHYEIPFAHHRIEAAKRSGIKLVPTIIRDLNNEQMIRMMAHENSEDYSTNFVVQLNTWEGGIQYLSSLPDHDPEKLVPLKIARLLGMTDPDPTGKHGDRLNPVGMACNAAHALIAGGHLNRDDLIGLSTSSAKELTQAMLSQMERIDKLAKISKSPAATVTKAKSYVSKAGKTTAKRTKAGQIARSNIRTEVNANAFSQAAKAAKDDAPLPLLSAFADALCRSLAKTLHDDYAADKLRQIAQAVGQITLEEDRSAVRRVQFELAEIAKRAEGWNKRITPNNEKVIPLKQLEDRA